MPRCIQEGNTVVLSEQIGRAKIENASFIVFNFALIATFWVYILLPY